MNASPSLSSSSLSVIHHHSLQELARKDGEKARIMSSPFIGLTVKLTLHSQPGHHLHAKILSIDQASNTLTVQKPDGSQLVLNRTDISSLAAIKPAETSPKVASSPLAATTPPRSSTSTPVKAQSRTQNHASLPNKPAPTPSFADPAIKPQAQHLSAPSSDPVGSRSSTPSRSPRPAPKSAKKKQAIPGASRTSSPALANASLSDEFDFSAGLAAFDKKKIWDDIRASDHTDPASLLVSHNRIANGPVELVRGPNGVGPAQSVSTPDRGRIGVREGQQKLRPNEMVLSPSPERGPSPNPSPPPPASAAPSKEFKSSKPVNNSDDSANKPTYEQMEERIRKLEAELKLARRRNRLLEELAGLGLGVPSNDEAESDHFANPIRPSSPRPASAKIDPQQVLASPDLAVTDTARELSAMSLQQPPTDSVPTAAKEQSSRSSTPAALSSALAAAGFSVSSQETSTNSTPAPVTPQISSAPAAEFKQSEAETREPLFGHIVNPPVLTLLFPTAALQHAALSRMEAFYESSSNSKRYLTLQQAADERICRDYQGFNFPLRQGVQEWLDAMHETVNPNDEADGPKWWAEHCSAEENQLLDVLVSLNAISPYEGASSRNLDTDGDGITYVISCIASQAHSTLPHELLHALYFLSPSYRSSVSQQYASLSAANKKVIETDLGMRKYSPSVFEDEFQAYLAEGLGTEKEFGNKPAAECKDIADQLRAQVSKEWKKLGLDLEGGKQQEKWEDVKWQTLDRFAALQKANKKKNAAAGSPAKVKGGKKNRK